jgi:hypothetical protein
VAEAVLHPTANGPVALQAGLAHRRPKGAPDLACTQAFQRSGRLKSRLASPDASAIVGAMFDLGKSARGGGAAAGASKAYLALAGAAIFALGTTFAAAAPRHAKPEPTPTPAAEPVASATPVPAPEAAPLTAEQMASAVATDDFTVPSPGELFAALDKQIKPNWSAQYRGPLNTAYSDRSQIALNLGGLIADGFVAVDAMDAQEVKNLGRDILGLAKNLSINKEILARGNSITQFADDNDWNSLKEELEATQNDVKQAMGNLHDDELIALLTLGGWIRGTEVVSNVVLMNYSGQNAAILRQPYLVKYLEAKLDMLSPKTRDTVLIKAVSAGLDKIGGLVSFPRGDSLSKDGVQHLHDISAELAKVIASKTEK